MSTPIEWIKFAGSDVYHLATDTRVQYRRDWRQAKCGTTGHIGVLFVGTPEPLCPRCLAISQQ